MIFVNHHHPAYPRSWTKGRINLLYQQQNKKISFVLTIENTWMLVQYVFFPEKISNVGLNHYGFCCNCLWTQSKMEIQSKYLYHVMNGVLLSHFVKIIFKSKWLSAAWYCHFFCTECVICDQGYLLQLLNMWGNLWEIAWHFNTKVKKNN